MRPALVLPVLVAALLAAGCRPTAVCAQCGRDECRNLTVSASFDDGTVLRTCCPRCALRAIREQGRLPSVLTVRDWETSRTIPAAGATFVEGSAIAPCSADAAGPPTDERGCCLLPVYDRCSPSLLAFAAPDRAQAFAASQGGRLRTWDELAAEP